MIEKRKSKVSIENWIERCKLKHGNKYDYSYVHFKHLTDIVTILCDVHGEFKKRADLHLKSGCIRCSKNKKFHIDDIKKLLNENKYFDILDFNEYKGNRQKIQVVCKKEKHLTTKSIHHLLSNNVNCSKCSKMYKLNKSEWAEICNKIHNYKYDYSLVDYKNTTQKVKIICPKHGPFEQIPFSHKNGSGCKKCNKSIGENIISEILLKHNIDFIEQKNFDGLKYRSNLYFDFYLPTYNICIEFDGLQHHKAYYFFGGEDALKERTKRDQIKDNYCLINEIKLLRITYQINYLTKDKIYNKIEKKMIKVLNEIKI